MIVMKFGGTSVENAVAIDRVAGIVRSRLAKRPVVVVSAMAKVTDGLLTLARHAADGNLATALEQTAGLHERHRHAIHELLPEEGRPAMLAEIDKHGEEPPHGRWTIAVGGPHPPVAVALGPKFTTTWNPKGADFAMVVGEFYCAKLDAPVVFDIMREGIVYARLYDLRGRTVSSLLTVPGIEQTNY